MPAIRAGAGVGKVFEFGGSVVHALSTDERATLTNMTAELGGFTGLVEPDAETVRFLRERRGIDFRLEPWMQSDAGAHYAEVIRIDCSAMTPMVARPGRPGQRRAAGLAGRAAAPGHRLRRLVHRRQARGLRPLPRRAGLGRRARSARGRRRQALPAVRHRGRARLLHPPRLPRSLRGRRRRTAATGLRRLRQLRPGRLDHCRAGDGQRDQPQLSRPLRSRVRSGWPARRRWRRARSPGDLCSFAELQSRDG